MRNKIIAITCLFLTGFLVWAGQDWVFAKKENGITVHTRVIQGSSFKEFKGEAEITGTLPAFVAVLQDVDNYESFFESALNPKLLKRPSETVQIHYLETKAPWPVSNRDGIYQYDYKYNKAKKEVTISIKALPNYIDKKDGIIRVPKATGQWIAREISPNKIYVCQQLHADPGGSIPSWLANQSSVDLPFNTITNLKKRIVLKQYQNKQYSFLK